MSKNQDVSPEKQMEAGVRTSDRTTLAFTSLGLAIAFASNLLVTCTSQCTIPVEYSSRWMTAGVLLLLLALIAKRLKWRSGRYSEQFLLLAAAFIVPFVIPLASALFELLFLSIATSLFISDWDWLSGKSKQLQKLALSGVTFCFVLGALGYVFYQGLWMDWWRYALIVGSITVGGLMVVRSVERTRLL